VLNKRLAEQFHGAVAITGRQLLLRKPKDNELCLLDPVTDQTIWKKPLKAGSTILKSALPGDMIGTLTSEGEFSVLDTTTGRPLFEARLSAGKDTYTEAHFILDEKECYVFLCKQLDAKEGEERWQLFPQMQWLRSIPINGPAIALQRDTGKILWEENLPLQYLIVQRFNELPVLLCASVRMKSNLPNNMKVQMGNANFIMNQGGNALKNELALFSKQTGKAIPLPASAPQEDSSGERMMNRGRNYYSTNGYQELVIETHSGKVELKSNTQNVSMMLVPNTETAKQK